jgi:hypothetical protein
VATRKNATRKPAPSEDDGENPNLADDQMMQDNTQQSASPYGNYGMANSLYGGGMYGGGLYGGGMYGGMMSPMMMGGPFSGLYQILFGVQNVVMSLGQAVQLIGMNQQAIQQALDSAWNLLDHSIATFQELRQLEANKSANETQEQKQRRRRLKALRWALVMGTSWLVYKVIRRIFFSSRRKRLRYQGSSQPGYPLSGSPSYLPMSSNYSSGYYGSPSMYGSNMYGGGGLYGNSYYGGGGGYF